MKYHIKLIESVGVGVGCPTVTVALSAYAMLPCVKTTMTLEKLLHQRLLTTMPRPSL